MPPRRRTIPTRRPRVAGLTNRADTPDTDARATTVTEARPAEESRPAVRRPRTRPAAPAPAEAEPPVEDVEDVADTATPAGTDTDAPDDAVDETIVDESADDATAVDEPSDDGTVSLAKPSVADEPDADLDGDAEAVAAAPKPATKKAATKKAATKAARPAARPAAEAGPTLLDRLRTVPVLAGLLVVLVALALFFGIATASLRSAPAAANTALTDIAATAEVNSQIGDALERLYSYDFARLDENERDARAVITEGFTPDFDRLFSQVRELAPQQQAVVSAAVTVSAVRELTADRAVLVVFMDQQATTVASEEQVAAQGRLTVTAERGEDGRWRIAGVESR